MAEDQAAGVPPAAETAILALGAGAAGPEPAAAPGMGMGQGGGGLPPAAAAAAAGRTAAALPPQPLIAASPGLGQGADVRVQLCDRHVYCCASPVLMRPSGVLRCPKNTNSFTNSFIFPAFTENPFSAKVQMRINRIAPHGNIIHHCNSFIP